MKNLVFTFLFIFLSYFAGVQGYNVTVTIDMSSYTGPRFTSVMTNGGFKGWGDAISLTTDDDSLIWTATVPMNEGINDFRFEIGGSEVGWDSEWEGEGGANSVGDCFLNPYDNVQSNMRWATITGDSILPAVCWEKCTACQEEPTTGEITVSIDMSSYTGLSFTNVMMNGGFKGWGDAIALTTDDDSLIWTTTVTMNAGINDYRFEIGGGEVGWDSEWEGEGGANSIGDCFMNPYDNVQSNMRWIEVTGDAVLSTVCWESCNSCNPLSQNDVSTHDLHFTRMNSNSILISGLQPGSSIISLYDMQGRLASEKQMSNSEDSNFTFSNVNPGIYIIKVMNEGMVFNKKIIIR